MISKDDLQAILKRQPFTPLRLHFSNGATHDITHPDSIIVAGNHAAVAEGDKLWFITLGHIVEIEPLATVTAS
jgi:hypothetical protein